MNGFECNGTVCPMYSYCHPTTNNCTCIEIDAPKEDHCGSNGKTYSSLQELQNFACKTNQMIYASKKGPCQSKFVSSLFLLLIFLRDLTKELTLIL